MAKEKTLHHMNVMEHSMEWEITLEGFRETRQDGYELMKNELRLKRRNTRTIK